MHTSNIAPTRRPAALTLTLGASLLGLVTLSTVPPAQAITDSGNYTGAACQPVGNQSDIRYGTFGEANNSNTTKSRSVVCSLRTESSLNRASGYVTLRKHSAELASCTMHYRDYTGQSGVTQTRQTGGSGVQMLTFQTLTGSYDGQVHYICSLPKSTNGSNTGVVSFELDQS